MARRLEGVQPLLYILAKVRRPCSSLGQESECPSGSPRAINYEVYNAETGGSSQSSSKAYKTLTQISESLAANIVQDTSLSSCPQSRNLKNEARGRTNVTCRELLEVAPESSRHSPFMSKLYPRKFPLLSCWLVVQAVLSALLKSKWYSWLGLFRHNAIVLVREASDIRI